MLVETITLSNGCTMRPYTAELVPSYHAWFQDHPELLEATATEPLSLEEEYQNQLSWTEDPEKVTFILFSPEGDMVGDVNCFVDEILDDDCSADQAQPQINLSGEINIMIANPEYRRRGYAQAAVKALMTFVAEKFPGLRVFIAKIGESNIPSQQLFERMGYAEIRRVSVFQEVHFEMKVVRG